MVMTNERTLNNNDFNKPKAIIGHNLIFRDAMVSDAEFIIELRKKWPRLSEQFYPIR